MASVERFASWTVKERSQEFYALLLLLVTGVFGLFAGIDSGVPLAGDAGVPFLVRAGASFRL